MQLGKRIANKTNVELRSSYWENWPPYIGNSHTNECRHSAGLIGFSEADLACHAEFSLQLRCHLRGGRIYICNTPSHSITSSIWTLKIQHKNIWNIQSDPLHGYSQLVRPNPLIIYLNLTWLRALVSLSASMISVGIYSSWISPCSTKSQIAW